MSEQNDTAQVVADLKAARGELVKRGRCTGQLVDSGGAVCARGAIGCAIIPGFAEMTSDNERIHAYMHDEFQRFFGAEEVLRRFLPEGLPLRYVWAFNDDESTTDADVLNLFDKALAELGGLA